MGSKYLSEATKWELAQRVGSQLSRKNISQVIRHASPRRSITRAVQSHVAADRWGQRMQGTESARYRSPNKTQRKFYDNLLAKETARKDIAQDRFALHSRNAAKKLAGISLTLATAGMIRKAYLARKKQKANLGHRQYDVFPEYGHAVVPAHHLNRFSYDDGSMGRSVATYGEAVKDILNKNSLLENSLKR